MNLIVGKTADQRLGLGTKEFPHDLDCDAQDAVHVRAVYVSN